MFVYELSGCGFESSCSHLNFRFRPCFKQEFRDIQAITECGFTLKRVRDMIKKYSQMHRTGKYSQHSSIIWPVWLNGWVFVYELSGCGFESSCSQIRLFFCVWMFILLSKVYCLFNSSNFRKYHSSIVSAWQINKRNSLHIQCKQHVR